MRCNRTNQSARIEKFFDGLAHFTVRDDLLGRGPQPLRQLAVGRSLAELVTDEAKGQPGWCVDINLGVDFQNPRAVTRRLDLERFAVSDDLDAGDVVRLGVELDRRADSDGAC